MPAEPLVVRAGIAGSGLMGRLLAWQLSQLGWSVTLFDTDITGRLSAAYAAAGMLSPYAEYEADATILQLGLAGIARWQALLAHFPDQSWFSQTGSIVLSHAADRQQFNHLLQHLAHKVPGSAMQQLTPTTLAHYEPQLHAPYSVFLPDEAVIDTRKLLQVLKTASATQINCCDKTHVIQIKPHTIITAEHHHQFDWVFDCRGIGGSEHFPDLRPVRGELIYVYAPEVTLSRPVRLMHPRYPLYIVPRPQSIYAIGASEVEADDRSEISVRTCLELLSAAYSVHRGFAEARLLETITALRPALTNHLPRIVYQHGMMAINGLYRHGFLLAPVLLAEILHLLDDANYQSVYIPLIHKGKKP